MACWADVKEMIVKIHIHVCTYIYTYVRMYKWMINMSLSADVAWQAELDRMIAEVKAGTSTLSNTQIAEAFQDFRAASIRHGAQNTGIIVCNTCSYVSVSLWRSLLRFPGREHTAQSAEHWYIV